MIIKSFRFAMLAIGLALAGLAVASSDSQASEGPPRRALTVFNTMYGVEGPFLGAANAIRGLPGDDLPWEIASAMGSVSSDGRVTVFVRGLVFPDDESVPEELRGINDEEEFRAVVSCLSESGGMVTEANVATAPFPADIGGNSFIWGQVDLPNPCVAPVVFIVPGDEDYWLAVSGHESEEEEE